MFDHWLETAMGRIRAGDKEHAVMADYGWVLLTDAEREAVEWFAEVNKPLARLTKSNRREQYIATLRGLLERTSASDGK